MCVQILKTILSQVVPEKSLTPISIFITLSWEIEEEKYRKNNSKINLSTFVLYSATYLVVLIMYTTFEDSSTHRCWAGIMEKFIGKKKKMTNKGNDKQWVAVSLIHSTTNHYQAIKSWVKLFQWNMWRKFSICITYDREMEKPNKKMKAKQIISIVMILHTIHMANLQVYTFEEANSNGSWEICYRIFCQRKRKLDK